jgi:hypothetical protein
LAPIIDDLSLRPAGIPQSELEVRKQIVADINFEWLDCVTHLIALSSASFIVFKSRILLKLINTRRLLVDMPLGQLPKSLASSSLYDASPNSTVGSQHLRLGKFAFNDAKRLFRTASIRFGHQHLCASELHLTGYTARIGFRPPSEGRGVTR